MSSDRAPASLVSAWQQQQSSGFRMVPSEFARHVRADVRTTRRWIGRGVVISAFLILWSGGLLLSEDDPLLLLGALLTLLALAFSVAQIGAHSRRVRTARFDADRTSVPSLAYARAYLSTRREFHRGRWLWSRVMFLFPGPPLVVYGARNESSAWIVFLLVWVGLLLAAVFVVQRRAERRYDHLLRELDDIERQSPVERFLAAHEQWKGD